MARKWVDVLRMDMKMMGPNAFVPIGAVALYLLALSAYTAFGDISYEVVTRLGEFLLPMFAAWWPIFLFVPMVESAGGEVFFSYPTGTAFYGLARVAALFALYEAALALAYCAARALFGMAVGALFLQTSIQCLFFSAFGYLLILLTRNSGLSLVLVATYALSFQIGGSVMPRAANVFLRNASPALVSDLLAGILPVSVCLSAAFCALAHLRLNALRRG